MENSMVGIVRVYTRRRALGHGSFVSLVFFALDLLALAPSSVRICICLGPSAKSVKSASNTNKLTEFILYALVALVPTARIASRFHRMITAVA